MFDIFVESGDTSRHDGATAKPELIDRSLICSPGVSEPAEHAFGLLSIAGSDLQPTAATIQSALGVSELPGSHRRSTRPNHQYTGRPTVREAPQGFHSVLTSSSLEELVRGVDPNPGRFDHPFEWPSGMDPECGGVSLELEGNERLPDSSQHCDGPSPPLRFRGAAVTGRGLDLRQPATNQADPFDRRRPEVQYALPPYASSSAWGRRTVCEPSSGQQREVLQPVHGGRGPGFFVRVCSFVGLCAGMRKAQARR